MGHEAVGRQLTSAFEVLLTVVLVASPGTARADEIDRYIDNARDLYRIPAVVVGVIRDGKVVDVRARGQSNVELGVRASPRHVFEIGSISKQFTTYAVLILAEEGKLDLNAPIGNYVAGLPSAWQGVTLHRLLTHTSGLPDFENAFGYGVYRETPTDDEFVARLAKLQIEFQPGAKWSYSNTNYWLLARAIERVSGVPYADFMRTRVFEPLGMASTRSALPRVVLPGRASGYEIIAGKLENRDAVQPNTTRGLGDLVTTVADMARWEREQRSPRLVSKASSQLARAPVKLNDGSDAPYGYGWQILPLLPKATLSHSGGTPGFSTMYLRVPERGLAIVVFSNAFAMPSVTSIARYVAKHVDPALATPSPKPIADDDPASSERVSQVLRTQADAPSAWRAEWFTPEFWKEIKPYLSTIAERSRALGPVRRVVLVGRESGGEERTVRYRATYDRLSRIVSLTLDKEGRISLKDFEDE